MKKQFAYSSCYGNYIPKSEICSKCEMYCDTKVESTKDTLLKFNLLWKQ